MRVSRDGFARFLAARERGGVREAWPELYLAFACGTGDTAALRHFEQRYLGVVRTAVRHLNANADEVRQLLRVRFFVGPPPRILDYQGLGSLEGWVRAAAVRLALDLKRRDGVHAEAPAIAAQLAPADPELVHLKAAHGPAFARAFSEACTTLSSRERAVLKLAVLDGASIDQLAGLYGINRATAARWLERIREALRERTMVALGTQLDGTSAEAASLVRALVSGLHVSLRRQLASTGAP